MMIAAIALSVLVVYAAAVLYMLSGLKKFTDRSALPSDSEVTIIVCARNEEENIVKCIESILVQKHTNFRLVIADDGSSDSTPEIVKRFCATDDRLSYISLPNSAFPQKKLLIEQAVRSSSSQWICLTDADCIHDKDWLSVMLSKAEEGYKLVCGPVRLSGDSFFARLQALEFSGLIGITASGIEKSSPVMCNAANLLFSRQTFIDCGGYSSDMHVASGDDVFLMQKISLKFPGSVGFCSHSKAIVSTPASSDVNSFISQRIRWTSKLSKMSPALLAAWIGGIVLVMNSVMLLLSALSIFSGNFGILLLTILLGKTFLDGAFLFVASGNLKQRSALVMLPFFELLYPVYSIMLLAGTMKGKYNWKQREVRL